MTKQKNVIYYQLINVTFILDNMSQKKAKKLRQLYRRDYRGNLKEAMEILESCLNEKPKWVHRKIWLWLISFFFDVEKFKNTFFK